MTRLSGFGVPKQQRFAMPFSYNSRPSLWQGVKSNSHLVIAAVGTAALLGVAGTALWFAMPAGDRQAFAQMEQPAKATDAPAQAEPAQVQPGDQPASASGEPAPKKVKTVRIDPVTLQEAQSQDDIAALTASDPRWSGSTPKQARAPAKAVAEAQKEVASAIVAPPPVPTPEQAASVAAYQSAPEGQAAPQDASPVPSSPDKATPDKATPDRANPDKAETAAIPAAKPAPPASEAPAGGNGHILRAVTMRAGPKKGAAAIDTIPAKAAVKVMSCKSWCEIVYKGKQGWIYKSFLGRDG